MAPSTTVIKIKFGNSLRRFNAATYNKEFDFNMAILRKKIRTLFGLNPDVDFTLTYIDDDEDEITLCDDDELHDIAAQLLDPIRITVCLNTENHCKSSVTSSENSVYSKTGKDTSATNERPSIETPLKKTYNHSNGLGSRTNHEATCDGCGVFPITGPRFMSKWIHDFDLCCTCFEKTGHDASDYVRMDFSPFHNKSVSNQVCDKSFNEVATEDLFHGRDI